MRLRTYGYCLENGLLSLFKNRLMAFASIGTISACLFVIGLFYTVVVNVQYTLDELENNIGIAVFFKQGISTEEINVLKQKIVGREEVESLTYISPDEAWEMAKKDLFEGKEDLLVGIKDGDNPLKDSASFQIYIKDINMQKQLTRYIESLDGVRHVRQAEEVAEVVQGFNSFIQYICIILIIVLILISVFLISNTIRIAVESRKKEIGIMKYIGATDGFVRGPFIVEGLLIGIIGCVLPLLIIYYSYDLVIERIYADFAILENLILFMNVGQVIQKLIPLCLIIGVGIGFIGSSMTLHKHLKV